MEIVKRKIINKPISEVWKVLAIDFDKTGEWMTGVKHSYETEGPSCEGSPMNGRVCEFSTKENGPRANERITLFDKLKYELGIQIKPQNINVPVIKNDALVSLKKIDSKSTQVIWKNSLELQGH